MRTYQWRPDLLKDAVLSKQEREYLEKISRENGE